jgi:hypothetical protein
MLAGAALSERAHEALTADPGVPQDSGDESSLEVARMNGDRDDDGTIWMHEVMMTASRSMQRPSATFEHADELSSRDRR